MKKYYISSVTGNTALSRYSNDFYELVLRDRGYLLMDSSKNIIEILSTISSRDQVHFEIGLGQRKEVELLLLMLKAKYKYVSVTLHDPPLIKYPFFEFKNPVLNGLSKLYDKYANNFGAADGYIRRIKSIYVLSRKGIELTKKKYKMENVYYLPYIISQDEIERNGGNTNVKPEYRQNESNGFYLSGSPREDMETIRKIISDPSEAEQRRRETLSYLIEHHSADAVRKQFKD
jgi:hypothetical protein